MLDALRQDWAVYRKLAEPHDRQLARSLSMADRFARYEDLYRLVCGQSRPTVEQERLEKRRWQQKLVLREKQNRAFVPRLLKDCKFEQPKNKMPQRSQENPCY